MKQKTHNKTHHKKKKTTRGGGCGCGGNKQDIMKGGGDGFTNPASITYHGSGQNYYPHNTLFGGGGDPNDPSNMIGARGLPNMGMRGGGSKKKTKKRKHTIKRRRKMKGGYPVSQSILENSMVPSFLKAGGNFMGPPVSSPSALASPQISSI